MSPAIRVRCCLEEGGKSETAKNQKSHRKVQHCEEPRGENNQGQVENLSMSTPTTVQGCCWMGPAPPALEHPTSHTEAHKSSMFIQPLGEPLSYQQQLSEGTRSTRCCCRLDLHHPRLRTSDQLAHENCQAPEKQPSLPPVVQLPMHFLPQHPSSEPFLQLSPLTCALPAGRRQSS